MAIIDVRIHVVLKLLFVAMIYFLKNNDSENCMSFGGFMNYLIHKDLLLHLYDIEGRDINISSYILCHFQKPEDLWAIHSKAVLPKPHRKDCSSWIAIQKVTTTATYASFLSFLKLFELQNLFLMHPISILFLFCTYCCLLS